MVVRSRAAWWVVASLVLVSAACGGGSDGGSRSSADDALASLDVFSRRVAVRTTADFVAARDGQDLSEGDKVRTDPAGFAEVTFFEGSWMRVDSGATLTVRSLKDTAQRRAVSTGIDTGRSWQRVKELGEKEHEFEVQTPVATAAVRGTAFGIDCTTPDACTFSVVDGVVELRLTAGGEVTLRAGQRLTIRRGERAGSPEDVGIDALRRDPWIATNLALDESEEKPGQSLTATGLAGTYNFTRTVVVGNPNLPVGQTDTGVVALTCAGTPCVLESDTGWDNIQLVGPVLRSADSLTNECPAESGTGTIGLDSAVALRATAFETFGGRQVPARLEGTQTLAATRIPPTCDGQNDPVTFSLVLERRNAAPPAPGSTQPPSSEVHFGS